MISAIREEPTNLALAEDKPLEYLARYVNEQCRSGDALRLCALTKKLRTLDTANDDSIRAFYMGMMNHERGRKRLGVDPRKQPTPLDRKSVDKQITDWEFQEGLLDEIIGLLRSKVSKEAADELASYADMVKAKRHLVKTLRTAF